MGGPVETAIWVILVGFIMFGLFGAFIFGFSLLGGVVLAPIFALISFLIARRKDLDGARFALIGAVYSAMFLMPWIYLVLRMKGKRPPKKLVISTYVFMYTIWLSILAGLFVYVGFGVTYDPYDPKDLADLVDLYLLAHWSSILICGAAWLVSLVRIVQLKREADEEEADAEDDPADIAPRWSHVMPFGLTASWTLFASSYWITSIEDASTAIRYLQTLIVGMRVVIASASLIWILYPLRRIFTPELLQKLFNASPRS